MAALGSSGTARASAVTPPESAVTAITSAVTALGSAVIPPGERGDRRRERDDRHPEGNGSPRHGDDCARGRDDRRREGDGSTLGGSDRSRGRGDSAREGGDCARHGDDCARGGSDSGREGSGSPQFDAPRHRGIAYPETMAATAGEGPRFWDQLLQLIEEGRVVPVLGPDLLVSQSGGQPVHLYSYLAERLAEYLEVPADGLPATGALHEVACRFLGQNGQIEDIYSGLKRVFPSREDFPIPVPLLQLAAIRPFKLFVSTTLDPLLQQALDEVRFGGQPRTRVFAYSPSAVEDLDQSVEEMDRPAVFHLFGRLSAVPEYVVTEEDTLELIHALQSESRRPNRLFDELDRRQLLLLGGGFPDWLARFFLRISRRERLWLVRGRTDIVADARMRDDPSLVAFLKYFSSRTRISSQGAVEFVDELSRRWTERHPVQEAAPAAPEPERPRGTGSPLEMVPGAIFLSYASEDRAAVMALKEELESAGVDVWFDRDALEGGDDYEKKIRRNIESCSLFVPILSRHTLTSRRRFFRLEWDWADRVAVQAPPNLRYIVPLTLGDVAPDDPTLPDRFRRLHWERLAPDGPNPGIVEMLKRYFREYQRANQAEAS